MKLLSFTVDGLESFGILTAQGVIDVGAHARQRFGSLADALVDMEALASYATRAPDHALSSIKVLPPIPRSNRIICIGLNYRSHIAEMGRESPAYPMLFPRYPDSLVGAEEPLLRPQASVQFDFEGELAFVIGRAGRAISPSRALDHVAVQMRHHRRPAIQRHHPDPPRQMPAEIRIGAHSDRGLGQHRPARRHVLERQPRRQAAWAGIARRIGRRTAISTHLQREPAQRGGGRQPVRGAAAQAGRCGAHARPSSTAALASPRS